MGGFNASKTDQREGSTHLSAVFGVTLGVIAAFIMTCLCVYGFFKNKERKMSRIKSMEHIDIDTDIDIERHDDDHLGVDMNGPSMILQPSPKYGNLLKTINSGKVLITDYDDEHHDDGLIECAIIDDNDHDY